MKIDEAHTRFLIIHRCYNEFVNVYREHSQAQGKLRLYELEVRKTEAQNALEQVLSEQLKNNIKEQKEIREEGKKLAEYYQEVTKRKAFEASVYYALEKRDKSYKEWYERIMKNSDAWDIIKEHLRKFG